jgi:hypothetical protein
MELNVRDAMMMFNSPVLVSINLGSLLGWMREHWLRRVVSLNSSN